MEKKYYYIEEIYNKYNITKYRHEVENEIFLDIFNKNITENDIDLTNSKILNVFGLYFQTENINCNKMMSIFDSIINNYNNTYAMNNLGLYYYSINEFKLAESLFIKALKNDNSYACIYLAKYCLEIEFNVNNAITYLRVAIDKYKNSYAMIELALIHKKYSKKYDKTIKFLKKALYNSNIDAAYELGYYYEKNNDYEQMKKYYKIALVNSHDIRPMIKLMNHHHLIKFNEELMLYYGDMAIKYGSIYATHYIGTYFYNLKKYPQMKKYYILLVNKIMNDFNYVKHEDIESIILTLLDFGIYYDDIENNDMFKKKFFSKAISINSNITVNYLIKLYENKYVELYKILLNISNEKNDDVFEEIVRLKKKFIIKIYDFFTYLF